MYSIIMSAENVHVPFERPSRDEIQMAHEEFEADSDLIHRLEFPCTPLKSGDWESYMSLMTESFAPYLIASFQKKSFVRVLVYKEGETPK